MWKFLRNLWRKIFSKPKRTIKFLYNDRKVKAVAIGKNVTMKIEQPVGMPELSYEEMNEILEELARRLR